MPLPARPSYSFSVPKPSDPFKTSGAAILGLINGYAAGSTNEYYVSLALNKLKLTYDYQYSIMGGNKFKGGVIIDFLVNTVPVQTPLWVQGDYWHNTAVKREADQWAMKHAKAYFSYQVADPVEIWGHECNNVDDAYNNLKRILKL